MDCVGDLGSCGEEVERAIRILTIQNDLRAEARGEFYERMLQERYGEMEV
jgi:hypothetical protein